MGEPLRNLDLQDRRLIDVLTKTSISPSRRLNGPYDSSVPFGTDRRFVDSIVSAETAAAEGKLRSALARYSAAELGVQALHATERILTHPFFGYLKKIRESAAMRREMEDSETIAVPILGSGIQGGSVADYRNFVDAIEILARAIRPPDI
jgi:hypothetical protein